MNCKVLFDHVPKTGGTSIIRYVEKAYGTGKVSPALVELSIGEAINQYSNYSVVTGHFRPIHGELPRSGWITATCLREPCDRLLSVYCFYRYNIHTTSQADVRLAKSVSFEDFVRTIGSSFCNSMTNHFSAYLIPMGNNVSDEARFTAAIDILDSFDLVGIFEDLEDFAVMLVSLLGVHALQTMPHERRSIRRKLISDLEPKFLAELKGILSLDIKLYEYVRSRFKKRRRDILALGTANAASVEVLGNSKNKQMIEAPVLYKYFEYGSRVLEIFDVQVFGDYSKSSTLFSDDTLKIELKIRAKNKENNATIGIQIIDDGDRLVFGTNSRLLGYMLSFEEGETYFVHFLIDNQLGWGKYTLNLSLHRGNTHFDGVFHDMKCAAGFTVSGNVGNHFEGRTKLRASLLANCHSMNEVVSNCQIALPLMRESLLFSRVSEPIQNPSFEISLAGKLPEKLQRDERWQLELLVKNTGSEYWPSSGARRVCLSYHIYKLDGQLVLFDGLRTELESDIDPGRERRLWSNIKLPSEYGQYTFVLTLIQEGVCWFEEAMSDNIPLSVRISVK